MCAEIQETRSRATVARAPIGPHEKWSAVDAVGRRLDPQYQPTANLQLMLTQFYEAMDGIADYERPLLGSYLAAIHGNRLLLGDREFAIHRRRCKNRVGQVGYRYHLSILEGYRDCSRWQYASVFDGRPFKGPLINLYSKLAGESGACRDQFAESTGDLKRGTLGALLFGILEKSGQTCWPRMNRPLLDGAMDYFSALQIAPGVPANRFLFNRPYRVSEYGPLVSSLRQASSLRHQACAFYLLEITKVDGPYLILPTHERITLKGKCRFPGYGQKFSRAIGLVSFARDPDNLAYGYRDAFVIPTTACEARLPVESSHEARVLSSVVTVIKSLKSNGRSLITKKPLFCRVVNGRLVRPDIEISEIGQDWHCYLEVRGFSHDCYQNQKDATSEVLRASGLSTETIDFQAHALHSEPAWSQALLTLAADIRRVAAKYRGRPLA